MFNKIGIIGLGYIGLPTAAVFADAGVAVAGVDVNPAAVAMINAGKPHIFEPNLELLLQRAVREGRLTANLNPEPADAFIIAVPTPFKEGHKPDLRFIAAAAKSLAPVLAKGNLVILESTSPVGTTEQLGQWLAEARPDLSFPQDKGEASDIRVAYCPERVLPGKILHEVIHNDRIIGGLTPKCALAASQLYKIVVKGGCHLTTARTAELAKLSENSFRDVNIAFANEIATVAERSGVNPWELIRLANLHPRVNILQPGPGVGGHCIAVDPWFIVDSFPDETRLIATARAINDGRPHAVVARARAMAARQTDPVMACLGLSYKANIDDVRESPAMEVVKELARSRAGRVIAVDPYLAELPADLAGLGVEFQGLSEALSQASLVILLVDHDSFRTVDRALLLNKTVIDTRGIWLGA